jgi:hypothetical protein
MIEVTEFQLDFIDIVKGMHLSQNSPSAFTLHPDTLPKIGYIASDSALHIAAGFLRIVEGGYAQIDSLVSNADAPAEMRNKGINLVVDSLINKAKELKLKGIISFTSDKSVVLRAVDIGFHVSNQVVIVLPLEIYE